MEKQLQTERYMRDMKRRIKWWRAHEERKLRGGFIWQRTYRSIKRNFKSIAREKPFDAAGLPKLSAAMRKLIVGMIALGVKAMFANPY